MKPPSSLHLASLLLAGLLGLPACGGGGSSGGLPPLELGESDPGGPDFDGDGVSDAVEIRGWLYAVDLEGYGVDSLVHPVAKSNYKIADSDLDGIGDRTEFQLRLNPSNRDTDLDGLTDREEIQIWQTKPASVDTDGDARGPSGTLTAEPRLFDGNETRLLCDGEDDDPSLCRHLGTSPTLADTDGDGRTDYEEMDEPGRSPLIAEIPLCKVELVGEIDVRLNVEYAESLGQSTEYGTSVALSTSESTTEIDSETHTASLEVMVGADSGVSFTGPRAALKSEVTAGYSFERNDTTETTSASEMVRESSRLQADSRERTETASSGRISMGVQLTNTSDVTFEVENFALALLHFFPSVLGDDSESDAFKTLGTLRPDLDDALGNSFVLSPGEVVGPIPATSEDVNADVIKEFMARPESLVLRPIDLNIIDAEGRNIDFLTEVTERRSAKVQIHFGDGRSLRYRVATNGRRTEGGGLQGLTVSEALDDVLGLEYLSSTDGVQLLSLDRVEGEERPLEGDLPFPYWSVNVTSDRFEDEEQVPERFEDIVLFPGDELSLTLIRDSDGDELPDLLDTLPDDSHVSEGDSDGDGLSDRDEVLGWDVKHITFENAQWVEFFLGQPANWIVSLGVFADYTFQPGDMVEITGGPVALGTYEVVGRASDDIIALATSIGPSAAGVHGVLKPLGSRHASSHLSLVDTDGDGLDDFRESPYWPTHVFGANPTPTDPTMADTDGDGLLDGEDEFPLSKASVLYVNAAATGGTGSGTSWENAHTTLSAAIANLRNRNSTSSGNDEVSEVWVAGGTYGADWSYGATNRVDRVRLYGGFQGGETKRGQRTSDPLLGGTVINAQVQVAAKDVVIDGFVFEGVGTFLNVIDSGVSRGNSKAVRNCLFNNCDHPGGISGALVLQRSNIQGGSSFLVEDCQFVDNDVFYSGDDGPNFHSAGGAITAYNAGSLLVRRCLFQNNSVGKYGGAICNEFVGTLGSNITVQDSRFIGNTAGLSGGAIWCGKGSTLNISHCEFLENKADLSGGAVEIWEAKSNIVDSLFLANGVDEFLRVEGTGGAVFRNPINDYYGMTLETSFGGIQSDGRWARFGGAVANRSGELNMVNCTVVKNYAIARDFRHLWDDFVSPNPVAWGAGVAHLVEWDRMNGAGTGPGPEGTTAISNTVLWGNAGGIRDAHDVTDSTMRWSMRAKDQVGQGYARAQIADEGVFQNWGMIGGDQLEGSWSALRVFLTNCALERYGIPQISFGHAEGIASLDPALESYSRFEIVSNLVELPGTFIGGSLSAELFSGNMRLNSSSPYLNEGGEFVDIDRYTSGFQSLRVGGVDWYFGGKLNGRFVPVDLDKKARFVGGVPGSSLDLGAYERQE